MPDGVQCFDYHFGSFSFRPHTLVRTNAVQIDKSGRKKRRKKTIENVEHLKHTHSATGTGIEGTMMKNATGRNECKIHADEAMHI